MTEKMFTEPTFNDFMLKAMGLKAKFAAEGNVDSEFDSINAIILKTQTGELTIQAGMAQLDALDYSRIER